MPPQIRNFLVSLLAILGIIGFACVSTFAFYKTLTTVAVPPLREPLTYLANSLNGLVGGIVAVGFGVSPPSSGSTGLASLVTRNIIGLGSFIVENQSQAGPARLNAKQFIGALYALIYILVGIAAIVVWASDDNPPELVKTLAMVSIGMFGAIITAFLRDN